MLDFFRFLIGYLFRVLRSGRLRDHGIGNGSRIILLPSVESGFSVSFIEKYWTLKKYIENLDNLELVFNINKHF